MPRTSRIPYVLAALLALTGLFFISAGTPAHARPCAATRAQTPL